MQQIEHQDSREFLQNLENQEILKEPEQQQSTFMILSSQNYVQSYNQIGQTQQNTEVPKGFEKLKKKPATIQKITQCCNKVLNLVKKRQEEEKSFEELDIIDDETIQKRKKKMFKIKLKQKDLPSYTISNMNSKQLSQQMQQVDQKQFQNTLNKIQKLKSKSSIASNQSINGSVFSQQSYFALLCKKNANNKKLK